MDAKVLQILLIGTDERLLSPVGLDLLSGAKLEFASAAAVLDGAASDQVASADAILLDAGRLPRESSREFLEGTLPLLLERDPHSHPIVLVGGDDGVARAAARLGAWDVVSIESGADQIAGRLQAAARLRRLQKGAAGRGPASSAGASLGDPEDPRQMVGASDAIRRVFALIRRVAATDVPVLLTGESGTGKELSALAIHERSGRAEAPFVPINCGAIPEQLLESELFGHERGAFTGATSTRRGRFEAADGGTLFLDEIGELAPSLQVKLLRFLEDHVVERVGGSKRMRLDVRVIAASNCDLAAAVERGEFREDLYYRLAVFTILLPPLRERGEDPVLMAKFFLDRYANQAGKPIKGFAHDAIEALRNAPWPGNVRELVNRVRRAVVLSDGPLVGLADLDFEPADAIEPLLTLREARQRAERECLRRALLRTRGNKSDAARTLGIGRTQLYELMRRHAL